MGCVDQGVYWSLVGDCCISQNIRLFPQNCTRFDETAIRIRPLLNVRALAEPRVWKTQQKAPELLLRSEKANSRETRWRASL